MKKLLLSLLLIPALGKAQITSAIIKANFGIDADLQANNFNNSNTTTEDDWYVNTIGTGIGVIDTTGAAAIVQEYINNPIARRRSFSRLMGMAPFSVVNNYMLIDAVFHRDFHGDDSTVFASGSNKNGMSPADWSCPVSQNIPDKNDILDVYAHVRRAGANIMDSLFLFAGISIQNPTGNRYFDFELFQTDLFYNNSTGTFNNYGPDSGHTSWQFKANGDIDKAGDIIFSAEFGTSALTNLETRIWVHRSALAITPSQFDWGGAFDGDGSGAEFGYASIRPKTSGAFYTGLQSNNNTWAGPFSLVLADNTLSNNYAGKQFMEFSVNMSKLGLDPAAYSLNPCNNPFKRVMVKSRSSTSFSSELKDFVAPFRMFNYPSPEAWANIIYFCGAMPTIPLTVINANNAAVYTWQTNDGNIVGSTTGSSILVNSPGTYYVNQQLHVSCPVFATDSIKIMFDPVCAILDIQIMNFSSQKNQSGNVLQWKLKNNENAKKIEVEYSTNGFQFNTIATIISTTRSGDENYSYSHNGLNIFTGTHYYRLKVSDATGKFRYSEIISISNKSTLLIFPNPSSGITYLQTQNNNPFSYTIQDEAGKLLFQSKKIINTNGLVKLDTERLPSGIYHIVIYSNNNKETKTLFIQR